MSGQDSKAMLKLKLGGIRGSSHMALSSQECGICCIVLYFRISLLSLFGQGMVLALHKYNWTSSLNHTITRKYVLFLGSFLAFAILGTFSFSSVKYVDMFLSQIKKIQHSVAYTCSSKYLNVCQCLKACTLLQYCQFHINCVQYVHSYKEGDRRDKRWYVILMES